ncbi:MAG: mechanosensitive ion channel [Thermoplasmatales archaeon]|nr:mechanosensitive ion channel [Thermoplasmatales archaeon]
MAIMEEIQNILNENIPLIDKPFGRLIAAILIIIIGYIIAIIISRSVRKMMLRAKMSKILADFSGRIFKILILIFVLITAVGLFFPIGEAIIALSVASGFIIGFAFQDTLGNLAAGFMIALTRPFKAGDYVDVAGKSGSVNSVGISITTMTTVDNKRVIIPNSKVWGSPIVNYTALNKRMIDMRIGIGYDDNMGKAITAVMSVLTKNKQVLKDPAPTVAVAELGDSSVNLLVRPWVNTSDYWGVKWEITQQLKEAFDKEGISIPFPQRDVHLFQEK